MKKIYFLLLLAVATLGLASCSDSDDSVTKTPLEQPVVASYATTVNSLTFNWSEVEGATQYAYELYTADGTRVDGGISPKTSITFTGLDDNTAYTFKVWAYGAVLGDKSQSATLELTASTDEIVPLDKPNPDAETGNGTVTITWTAVPNAASYTYTYVKDGETITGTTTDTSVTLRGLSTGDYTVTVTAISGQAAYSDSEAAVITFHVNSRQELWRKSGYYWSHALKEYFDADLVAYDDDTYTIEHPYGVEGRDITFSVNSSGGIDILNSYSQSGGYYYVDVSNKYYLAAYTAQGYSSYSYESDEAGIDIWFGAYLYDYDDNQVGDWDYDEFIWSKDYEEGMTIDDLVGTYTSTDTGYTMFADWNTWQTLSQSETVTITKVDDNTVTIGNFFDWNEDVSATVDTAAKTITLELKTDWGGYYTLCLYDKPTEQVVGTIADDGTITFEDFTAYYAAYAASYLYGTKSVLTKQ